MRSSQPSVRWAAPELLEIEGRRSKEVVHSRLPSNHRPLAARRRVCMSSLPQNSIIKTPSAKAVSFNSLVTDYGAAYFRDALDRYVVTCRDPYLSSHAEN